MFVKYQSEAEIAIGHCQLPVTFHCRKLWKIEVSLGNLLSIITVKVLSPLLQLQFFCQIKSFVYFSRFDEFSPLKPQFLTRKFQFFLESFVDLFIFRVLTSFFINFRISGKNRVDKVGHWNSCVPQIEFPFKPQMNTWREGCVLRTKARARLLDSKATLESGRGRGR